MSSKEERFDAMLLGLAQQHEGGVPDLMNTLFGFLSRKTDFYTGGEKALQMVMDAYNKHAGRYTEIENKKKKEEEERRKRQREQAEAKEAKREQEAKKEAEQPRVVEVTDEEEQQILSEQAKKKEEEPTIIPSNNEDEEKEKDDGRLKPNTGNGSSTENYSWTQTLEEIEIRVPVPEGTRKRDLEISIKRSHLKITLKGKTPLIDGDFDKLVKADDADWIVEDCKVVVVYLTKVNQMEWWSRLIKGEAEINTQKIQPDTSKLEDLDGETRGTVEKMMFDQRQKQMGLPTSEDSQKNEMMKKFMAQHPEMDFSKAKFN